MPAKKRPKVSDPNNPHQRKTKNRKSKQKSNSLDTLTANQISFFKAKYLSLITEIFVNYAKDRIGYKKIGASPKDLIAADIALQYLEKHCMQLTFQNAICESSNDLKRKFTNIWIAKKLQIRGKRDIIHGLVDAKKNNRFNIGFHGVIGGKNNSTNNIDNENANNQKQKINKISSKGSSDSIKLLNARVIEKNDNHSDTKSSSAGNSPILKKRRKKSNLQQQYQETEKESLDQSKSSKESFKQNSKYLPNNEPLLNQLKNSSKKRKKERKDDSDGIGIKNKDENYLNSQLDEFQIIEKSNKKAKANTPINNQYLNRNQDDNNDNENSDHLNDDIDLNELPPPLGTDSSDDNGELFNMDNQYEYNNNQAKQNKNDNYFKVYDYNDDNDDIIHNPNDNDPNKRSHPKNNRFNDKNDVFDNKFNYDNDNYGNKFDGKKNNFGNRFDYNNDSFNDKDDVFDDQFNDKHGNFIDDYKDNNFDIKKPINESNIKKDSKSGRTRVKSIGSHTHVHTNSGHNSNNPNKIKAKPKNNLNEVSHIYTYTYEEEDEYSESTQYEYPTHIYEYEDFDEEEEIRSKKKVLQSNNYDKASIPKINNKFPHEESLITGEIEIQTQEIDHINPILPSSNYSSEKSKKIKNKISNADNSYPSSGSPQNHSTSSNSLHEQKIKLTLQQNVEMIQNPTQEEKKQTKSKGNSKSKENSQIQKEEPSIIESQLSFHTFHTVDVQPNPELQRIFKQRKGSKQKPKESPNNDSNNNCEQIYFPLKNNANNSKIKENQNKKVQQLEPVQKKTNNSENEAIIPRNPINIHIKIVEAIIFKDSGFGTNIFKVRIKLASAREFAETRESTPSALQQSPDSNQLIAHHLWDEAFKIFCNTIENEEINVSVLALRNKNKTKQKTFDVVSTARIGLKSFVIDEISDVWINMKNIGRIHLLVCIKNFNPNEEDDYLYNEEEEEEEEAEMSGDENEGVNENDDDESDK